MDSQELIATMLSHGDVNGAAAVFAAEVHNQFQSDDLNDAIRIINECLPEDPQLRRNVIARMPKIEVIPPGTRWPDVVEPES